MITTFYENRLSRPTWEHLYNLLKSTKNPNIKELQQFLEAPYKKDFKRSDLKQHYQDYMNVLQLKLEALTNRPNPIEKTMTRSQLFLTDNPLWTNDMAPKDIIEIITAVQWLKQYAQGHHIDYILDEIINFDGAVNYTKLNKIYR